MLGAYCNLKTSFIIAEASRGDDSVSEQQDEDINTTKYRQQLIFKVCDF